MVASVRCMCLLIAAAGLSAQVAPATVAPFDWEQRWQYYLQRTYSWQRMGLLAVDTAFDHMTTSSRAWDRSPQSYAYRYGATFGSRILRNSVELGAGALLGEDTRFRPSRAETFGGRVRYATLQAFTGYHGEARRFAYSRLAATAAGWVAISLCQGRPLSPSRFAGGLGDGYLSHLQNSFLTEFGDDLKAAGRRMRLRVLGK